MGIPPLASGVFHGPQRERESEVAGLRWRTAARTIPICRWNAGT